MREIWGRFGLLLALSAAGCGDDHAGAGGSGTDGETDSAGDTDDSTSATTGDTVGDACVQNADCDDGDPCSQEVCSDGTCSLADEPPPLTHECRPSIEVDEPPRAATIETDDPTVTVSGTVDGGGSEVVAFRINGNEVAFDASGAFSHDVSAVTGGNTLIMEVEDAHGRTRTRVQSFLWSPDFRNPTVAPEGIADHGLSFFLAQESIDDGDRTPPYDDLASLLELVFAQFDVSTVIDPEQVVAHEAGYDIYVTDIQKGESTVSLSAIDGGIALDAAVSDIVGDLYFDCTSWECELAGGDGTGGFSIAVVNIHADLMLGVDENHRLQAELVGLDATVDPDDVEVWADNSWTNFLVSVAEFFVKDSLVADLEAALEDNIETAVGPALSDALGELALATSFDFPALSGRGDPIVVDLIADFRETDIHDGQAPPNPSPPAGGVIALRGGGYTARVVTPHENLGVPMRHGCGLGAAAFDMPRAAALEIALGDDLLNELLYGGWKGGLLEISLDDEVSTVMASGMLAPTASDCGSTGELLAHIGDLHIDAQVKIAGETIDFEAFTSLVVGVEITPAEGGISLGISGIQTIDTELTADRDEDIPKEPALVDVLESKVSDLLVEGLGNGLGAFELPPIDLSNTLGMPPGTAVIEIKVEQVDRIDGATLLSGSL